MTITEAAVATGRRHRLRTIVIVVVILALAAVAVDRTHPHGISFAHPLGRSGDSRPPSTDNTAATSTATVTRRSLQARTSLNGTLGYAGDYTVAAQGHGTITALPAPGQVIRQGGVLYRIDGAPVVLLYGSTPAYRALAEGRTADAVTGADVAQLNRDLVALGYGRDVGLSASSDEFSWETKVAVEELQEALGVKQTGKLDLGQFAFLPSAVRVTSLSATLGGPAGGAVFKATSPTRQVTVDLDAARQSQLKAGDRVLISLPDGRTTPGTVTSVGKVATAADKDSGSGATVEVDITPTDVAATGGLDQAPVQVAITTDTARNVLVVPVTALLALAGGGYAVEVQAAGGARHLVPVRLGLFDDAQGLVQVIAAGLRTGQHVVVPAS
ncbi:MAG TPA: peptidoglycan-binding protein [Mycobacteriales bacterium]|nr:peptidoglycan-binding protein [Mycobacteriales bacterium]